MHPRKLDHVAALPGDRRYGYFIRKVADFQTLWSLRDESAWASEQWRGEIVLPVWPERDFAAICATAAWRGMTPTAIELCDFLGQWTREGIARYRYFSVFPSAGDDPIEQRGQLTQAEILRRDLATELQQYL